MFFFFCSIQTDIEIQVHRTFIETWSRRFAQMHRVRHADALHHLEIRRERRTAIANVMSRNVMFGRAELVEKYCFVQFGNLIPTVSLILVPKT